VVQGHLMCNIVMYDTLVLILNYPSQMLPKIPAATVPIAVHMRLPWRDEAVLVGDTLGPVPLPALVPLVDVAVGDVRLGDVLVAGIDVSIVKVGFPLSDEGVVIEPLSVVEVSMGDTMDDVPGGSEL
jgi:hypothetical protein